MRKAFTREQTLAAIRREGFSGVPVFQAKWWGEGLREQYGDKLIPLQEDYPDDLCAFWFREPGYETSSNGNPEYRMGFLDYSNAERHSIGNAVVLLPDWDQLDAFLDHYPSPKEAGIFDGVEDVIKNADGRYKIGCWWKFLHERLWTIRGMENLMYDYYDNMDGLKCICEKILEFDMAIVDECARLGFDGIFTSDDLGHQRGPMMSPEIFRELYLPYYKQFIGYVHSKGMQMFLHSCGDNTLLMEDLLEAGGRVPSGAEGLHGHGGDGAALRREDHLPGRDGRAAHPGGGHAGGGPGGGPPDEAHLRQRKGRTAAGHGQRHPERDAAGEHPGRAGRDVRGIRKSREGGMLSWLFCRNRQGIR